VSESNGPSAADLAALDRYASALADALEAALGPWVERCVLQRAAAGGVRITDELRARTAEAAQAATSGTAPRIRALLLSDIDQQPTGPLAIVRSAVAFPTAVLRQAGVAPVARDDAACAMFPDDDYDLTPTSFAELDPALAELGIAWGAAKAHIHLARRRADTR